MCRVCQHRERRIVDGLRNPRYRLRGRRGEQGDRQKSYQRSSEQEFDSREFDHGVLLIDLVVERETIKFTYVEQLSLVPYLCAHVLPVIENSGFKRSGSERPGGWRETRNQRD